MDRVAFLERGDGGASTPSPALAGSLRYTDAVAAGSAARADSPEEAVGSAAGAGPPTTLGGGIFGGCGGACSLGGESGGGDSGENMNEQAPRWW